jgi:CubicO group peptidase (beta-lactamase class C family)
MRRLLVAALALLVASAPAAADPAMRDAAIQNAVANGFSGTILVVDHGDIVVDQAFGLADPQTPNKTSTAFRLGALSRLFVATAVVMLAEKGKLSLDNTAEQFVPGAGPGTIRDLLARPGDGTTALLANILAAVTQKDIADVLDTTMFGPLWMTGTALDDGRPSRRVAAANGPPPAAWMAVTTTRNLLRWTDAFFAGRLVSPAGRDVLLKAGGVWQNTGTDGWQASSATAAVVVRPDLTVIVLSNGTTAPSELAARLAGP